MTWSCVLLVVAACGGGSARRPPPSNSAPPSSPEVPYDHGLEDMLELAKRMCACTSRECADAVQTAMLEWSEDAAKRAGTDKTPATDEWTRAMALANIKYSDCLAHALGID